MEGIRRTWSKMTVDFDGSREDCPLLADLSEVLERLESDSLEMLSMTSQGRFIEFCKQTVDEWSEKLQTVDSVLQVWQKFQTNWCRLEPIFMQSDDIRSQLPEDSKRFELLDNSWKDLMMEASRSSLIVDICTADGRAQTLADITDALDTCERSLNDYLEQKKKAFPRFYFVANGALLDILSNGNKPLKVAEYLGDVFDGIRTLDFSPDPKLGRIACGHKAKDGEFVAWPSDPGNFVLEGPVEIYLAGLEAHIRLALREVLEQARTSAESWEVGDRPRETWLDDYCAQLSLLATQIIWTEETARAFEDMEAGSETAMRDYKRVNDDRIDKLIRRVQGESDKELRTKVITIITIDVHSRDVIESFVLQKVNEANDFRWGSQLRFYWAMYPPGSSLVSFTPPHQKTCLIKICDWATCYAYEYIGNVGRLVITPLTDRCYITLTQALNLCLGGAPAGPAGTGKTETTKDLSRALGLPIVVSGNPVRFNCSDQMTYQTTAQIFMGLAQVGAWGCFDEFNRISIEVLSVVSTQYKSVLDAIRINSKTFLFVDEELRLVKTCGAFITMNPGYAGRTELPENLKALFRSVAMIVPNLKFICENMLMSEGFMIARLLAHKFVTLYSLSKAKTSWGSWNSRVECKAINFDPTKYHQELLSKQMHYDWGLRAVKSLLRQAGSLKNKERDTDENIVLCRALRDFNLPKITTQDMPIFQRLIKDLFPEKEPEEPEPEIQITDLSEEEKKRLDEAVKQVTNETLDQIHKERKWKAAAEELKPKLKARKFSTEKPEKTVLFISDGILSWPVAASAVKEDVMALYYDAKDGCSTAPRYPRRRRSSCVEALTADARVDILACELVAGETGMKVFKELEAESGINLAASTDLTGNKASGGNWLMETDGVNVKDTYFTEKIDAFNETLLGYAMHRKMLKKAGRVKYCVQATPFIDLKFRKVCEDTVKGRGLQPDSGFIDKVVDFLDILKVRHCCFIIGPTGAGKTEIWRSLEMSLIAIGEDCRWEQVNPKAITADELYGIFQKGEWKDGAISVIMRNMSKEIGGYKSTHLHKWVVLDGDIDATWIESMNTVMDDNKVLTLVSNERIPFTPTMRMLLEIQDMKHASPATVSRGGVLYINETDVGWKPFVESWREQMDPVAQSTFYMLFTHQFEGNIEQMRKNFAFTCPILDIGFVQTVTCLLDALVMMEAGGKEEGSKSSQTALEHLRSLSTEDQKLVYESFFTFALIWTLGTAVADDKIVNHRKAFSSFLRSMARGVKLPETGECFDYQFEVVNKEWVHWEKWVKPYEPVTEVLYQNIVISNMELERMKHLLDLHVKRRKPLLFVGVAGTAKTTIVKDYLAEVKVKSDANAMNSASINLNSYTTSGALQNIIVGCLEKRSGHTYGPPGHRRCVLFVDDLNMPYVDDYDTQGAIMLLTQVELRDGPDDGVSKIHSLRFPHNMSCGVLPMEVLSYGQVYDRDRLDEKKNIVDLLFTACMNPKAER
ncbi:unnamed protein product [Cladocopium goreaui]|uniref:Ciliary dynein heavy chain, putative n=1 Tax=Cladocopium goreaui TaxID=2562237 RepID=A0A9P1DS79_9DINO|nr:unnamed protein product [Cladocopium goreaui]